MLKRTFWGVLVLIALGAWAFSQTAPNLAEQALSRAKNYFQNKVCHCGNEYYVHYKVAYNGTNILYQCRDLPTVALATGHEYNPKALTRADVLNKVDPLPISWEGTAVLNLMICRGQFYYDGQDPGPNAWGAWFDYNGDVILRLEKHHANWQLQNINGTTYPITCADVPTAGKKLAVQAPTSRKLSEGEGAWYNNASYEVTLPANYGKWFSLGRGPVSINPLNPFTTINIDGTGSQWTIYSDQPQQATNSQSLAPDVDLGAVIVKIGTNGKPFAAFSHDRVSGAFSYFRTDSTDEIFIAINDSDFGDNRGAHKVMVGGPNVCLDCPTTVIRPPRNHADISVEYTANGRVVIGGSVPDLSSRDRVINTVKKVFEKSNLDVSGLVVKSGTLEIPDQFWSRFESMLREWSKRPSTILQIDPAEPTVRIVE